MTKKIVVKVGESANATCSIFAYPKAALSWSFETCAKSGIPIARSLTVSCFPLFFKKKSQDFTDVIMCNDFYVCLKMKNSQNKAKKSGQV